MGLVDALKCPNCGAVLSPDSTNRTICEFCKSPLLINSGAAATPSGCDEPLPASPDPSGLRNEVWPIVEKGRKIEAIQLVRRRTRVGLVAAKAYVEAVEAGHTPPVPVAGATGTTVKPKRVWRYVALLVFGAAFALYLPEMIRSLAGGPSDAQIARTPPSPRDDLELLVRRFGNPDSDESAEFESPRPPIVTRFLTYKAERVRAGYRADVPFGAPPPYDGKWKLIGFIDPQTNVPIRPDEAVARLAGRDNHYGVK